MQITFQITSNSEETFQWGGQKLQITDGWYSFHEIQMEKILH